MEPLAASFHSVSLTTKVEFGNSEIAEVWSLCRWVITTIGISPGSRPRLRSCAGTSSPGFRVGLPKRLPSEPKFCLPSVAIEGCRPVSTRIAPALGWRIRKAGIGIFRAGPRSRPLITFSEVNRPAGFSIAATAKSQWPATIGSTVTVAPGVPPASGSCRGWGSTWTAIPRDSSAAAVHL